MSVVMRVPPPPLPLASQPSPEHLRMPPSSTLSISERVGNYAADYLPFCSRFRANSLQLAVPSRTPVTPPATPAAPTPSPTSSRDPSTALHPTRVTQGNRLESQLEPILAQLGRMATPEMTASSARLTDAERQKEDAKWNTEIQKYSAIFIEKVSLFATLSRVAQIAGAIFNNTEMMDIIKQASTSNPLSGEKQDLWEVLKGKDFYKQLSYWQAFRCWITCWFTLDVVKSCVDQFIQNIVETVTKGVEQNEVLSRVGFELSKVLNFHLGKYLKGMETYAEGADRDGSLRDHIALQMQELRGETEKAIYAEFSKVLTEFLPDFPLFTDARKKSTFIYIITWPIVKLLNLVYKTYMQYFAMPSLISTMTKTGSSSAQFKPFAHALNCTLAYKLSEPRGISEVKDYLDPSSKQNIAEAMSKLLKILQLEPCHTRQEMAKILKGEELDVEFREMLLSLGSKIATGKNVEQQVNEAMQGALTDVVTIGFNLILEPLKAKEILALFMKLANAPFEKEVLRTREEWEKWNQEYKDKLQEVKKLSEELLNKTVDDATKRIVYPPSQDQQTVLMQEELQVICTQFSQMHAKMMTGAEAIASLISSANPSPTEILTQLETIRNAVQHHITTVYIRNRSNLSNEALEKIKTLTTDITDCEKEVNDLLVKMKELQMQRDFRLRMQAVQVSLSTKLQRAFEHMQQNSPLVLAEMQQIDEILQNLQTSYPNNSQLVPFRIQYQALSQTISQHEAQKAALFQINALSMNSGPFFALVGMIKRKHQTREMHSIREIQSVLRQIENSCQQIPDRAIREALTSAIARIEHSESVAHLEAAWRDTQQILTSHKGTFESNMRIQIRLFQDQIENWNRLITETTQTANASNEADHSLFQQKFRAFQSKLKQMLESTTNDQGVITERGPIAELRKKLKERDRPSLQLSAPNSNHFRDKWRGLTSNPSIRTATNAVVGRVNSVIDGTNSTITKVVTSAGAVIGTLAGSILGGVFGPVGLVAGGAIGAAAGGGTGYAFTPNAVSRIDANRLPEQVLEFAGSTVDRAISDSVRNFSADQIYQVVRPKVQTRVQSLYRLLQEENTYNGFVKATMQSTSGFFLGK